MIALAQRTSRGRRHRRRRRRLRRPADLYDRRLPRLSAGADRHLRREHQPCADLPAVRVEPGPDGAPLRVGVALHACGLANFRADGRLAARRSFSPLMRSAGRKFNPGVPEILTEAAVVGQELGYREARARRREGRLDHSRARPAGALLALRRGREPARALQARSASRSGTGRSASPGVYGEARENPETHGPRRPGLRAEGVPRGRPLPRGGLRHRRGERVGELRGGGRPVHRAPAQPASRRAGPERAALPVRRLAASTPSRACRSTSASTSSAQVLRGTAPQRRNWGAKVKQAHEGGSLRGGDRQRRRASGPARRG